jgi:hypothetical protein
MSSNLLMTEGPIFMNLGGRNRNMITEPFEEDEPEFPQYGEFKRQIEQLINTKTHSNIFRPARPPQQRNRSIRRRTNT